MVNQNLLGLGATKYIDNCCNTFTNFGSINKVVHTANEKAIISYGQRNMIKTIIYKEVTFQKALHISTLINNLYSATQL